MFPTIQYSTYYRMVWVLLGIGIQIMVWFDRKDWYGLVGHSRTRNGMVWKNIVIHGLDDSVYAHIVT